MEVPCDPAIVHSVLSQLRRKNAAQRAAFADVTADYLSCLQRARELQASDCAGRRHCLWELLQALPLLAALGNHLCMLPAAPRDCAAGPQRSA